MVLDSSLKAVLCPNSEEECGHSYVLVSDNPRPWFLSHVWSENYCHWLLDSLSDVYYANQSGFQIEEAAVFSDINNQFIEQSLSLLGIKRVFIERQCIHVKDWIIRDFNVVINPMRHTGKDSVNVIKWWNSKRLNLHKTTDVLLIRRNSTTLGNGKTTSRNIANEESLVSALRPLSVSTVEFDNIPMISQMAAISSARCVIGVSGAGLANVLFASPETTFIELQCTKQGRNRFKCIADAIGLQYNRFVYPKTVDNDDCYDWSLTVDPDEIASYVHGAIGTKNK